MADAQKRPPHWLASIEGRISKMPKVSVCIPVFNPGPFLKDAIESVLVQSFNDFELVVVDDASQSPVDATVAGFADARIRLARNPRNLGLVDNWNRCLELTQGQYVILFHQDDLMEADYLTNAVAVLESSPLIGFVYTDIVRIDATGSIIGGHHIPQPTTSCIMDGCDLFERVAQTGNPICCPTVLARRDCYNRLGDFDPRLPFATDLEMWLRIAAGHRVGFIAQPLVSYRVHLGQETTHFAGSGRDYQDVLKAYRITYARPLPPRCSATAGAAYATLARQAWAMARWQVRCGKLRDALRYGQVLGQALFLARVAPPSTDHANSVSH